MTNEQQEIYDIISGANRALGTGFHTYPLGNDDDKYIFSICLQLEQLGYIVRKIDNSEYVFWVTATDN
jgi:hypothetical protein